ncbi:hypothetical protein NDU88_005221 [Pleurodeles waltl]|uniref:Uncharacterized protein n=1 Tax=Pleurodeles waltl TaxID=8319 RepID=A0AAV7RJ15_PLEWA|nr:hypothetical protein NDU88_005221 [Pleurodeles waltl]
MPRSRGAIVCPLCRLQVDNRATLEVPLPLVQGGGDCATTSAAETRGKIEVRARRGQKRNAEVDMASDGVSENEPPLEAELDNLEQGLLDAASQGKKGNKTNKAADKEHRAGRRYGE